MSGITTPLRAALAATLLMTCAVPALAQETSTITYTLDGVEYTATATRNEDGTLTVVDYGGGLTAEEEAAVDARVAEYNERTLQRNEAIADAEAEGRFTEEEQEERRAEFDTKREEAETEMAETRATAEERADEVRESFTAARE